MNPHAKIVPLLLLLTASAGQAQADDPMGQEGVYDRPFIGSLGATSLGGYAEANGSYFREDGVSDGFSMEFRRFNIFLFSSISSRVRLLAELEFEHGTEEIALETALVDLRLTPSLVLRGGILLPPVGYFNLNHDSPRWNFVDRPLVATEVIPSTLSEVGFGGHGRLPVGPVDVSWDLYLTNGLQDGVVLNDEGRTHLASGKADDVFEGDNNGSPAVSGRLGVRHPRWGELGLSGYRAIYNTFEIEGEPIDEARRVTVVALDLGGRIGPLEVRAEAARATIDVPSSLAGLSGDEQWGAHLDLRYPLWHPAVDGWDEAVLSANLRLEAVDLDVGRFSATGAPRGDEVLALVPGLSFRPSPSTVVMVNYRHHWIRDLLRNPTTRLGGVQFGLATYF